MLSFLFIDLFFNYFSTQTLKSQKTTSHNLFLCFSKMDNAKQHCATVRDIWSDVDPYMQLHPNVLVESNLTEEWFFILKKEEWIRSEDLEPWEQSHHHIQAPTIVSKLQSFINFTEFLQNRKIFIDKLFLVLLITCLERY